MPIDRGMPARSPAAAPHRECRAMSAISRHPVARHFKGNRVPSDRRQKAADPVIVKMQLLTPAGGAAKLSVANSPSAPTIVVCHTEHIRAGANAEKPLHKARAISLRP